jgi:hypothetical protein
VCFVAIPREQLSRTCLSFPLLKNVIFTYINCVILVKIDVSTKALKTCPLSLRISNYTGCTNGVLGFDSRRGLGIFLFSTASRTALGPTQPRKWVPGAHPLGVKRAGHEADHSSLVPRSKNAWSYTSTPQYVFVAWCLVKHRGNFYFYLTALNNKTAGRTCKTVTLDQSKLCVPTF